MGTVYLGRVIGAGGFTRTVAIKKMHADIARDPDFIRMFLDEARLAASVHHPNVVSTIDVVATPEDLFVVMEYVHGEALATLVNATSSPIPMRVAARIVGDLLTGLHAAHEAKGEDGTPLGIVHRDVSPQNVLVGSDGITRVIDFGVAKAAGRLETTRDGRLKGKVSYMAPEQLLGQDVDRRTDVYAASVVLWELLTGTRLFQGQNHGHTLQRVLMGDVRAPSEVAPSLPADLDEVVMRGLARRAEERFPTARQMARAIQDAVGVVGAHEVSEWVEALNLEPLRVRAIELTRIENGTSLASETIDGSTNETRTGTAPDVDRDAARLVVRGQVVHDAGAPRQSRRLVVGAAIVVLGAGALLVELVGRLASNRAEPEPRETSSAIATTSSVAPPLPWVPSVPSGSVLDDPKPTTGGGAAVSSSAGRPKPSRAAPNCNPPFVIDSRGIRSFKRECVR
jgi:eukaryotic-like serine/threonine-protein kinase